MITHVNGGCRFGAGIDKCWIRSPSFPSILQVSLQATPLVPLQGTVACEQEQGNEHQDDSANLGDLNEVLLQVIDNRSIDRVAEQNVVLLRDRKCRLIEVNTCKGIVDVLLQQFKWLVDTDKEWMSVTLSRNMSQEPKLTSTPLYP